ncbi:MAG: type IV pili twitching motility protein PilT [Syntrophaceae bacterium CG2_30_49_12]|nr:MAG: type IV pili twitching motility protein PilT [Syntrophaceae bacterium CG2_30_49_12]PIP06822.1 MAG: type IV pili twitching motility protein PilT [Syntrophobacterales bacterium CG23_combo_of_CG06-09_8_20_14_all_48_27]PJA48210.1 MAG: type IV pili twitching motility protein PilT [Syntrophobacterales bacterium CG_4_9_14_3_um_filter_49_8]PJC74395.1 MAG: type IV pili twitching motility protein PilT [Syntrophobacterales bacterium CG_4_8_14_3_um_filter_49_14]
MAKIDAFFQLMHEQGASDLHLVSGQQPIIRIRGEIERIKFDVLDNDNLKAMLYEIAPEHKIKQFEETGDVDFAYEIPNFARYRANFFEQKFGVGAVFREIPSKIVPAQELGLPPVISKLASLPRGLVLVTGPTGSGKSTTLAAIIDEANRTRKDHIITIEDPIEFVHQSQSCIVNHREVGIHTKSFTAALRGALREDPDIILVGEMRDLETISLAVEAAATGHLVFGTLHTMSAAKTVDRIIEVFPAEEQMQIRSTLADGIRAVISQVLFKRIDKKGRCVALEILIATSAVRNLIRESKTFQIPSMIQTGKKYGMQLLDDSIMDLYNRGWISSDDAYSKCNDKSRFRSLLKSPPTDFTEV